MANTTDVVSAIRELTNTKQLERGELIDLLKDGLHAALVKRYGPNVRAEIGIDEMKGSIRIVVLKTVVEAVEDAGTQVTLEEARFEDPDFQPGDVLEEEVPFEQFGRTAVQAAKQRIIQRVREGERSRIREEFSGKVGELLSGEVQQIERGKIVVMLNKFREAEAIIPYRDQNHREHFHQGDTIRAVLKRIEETPKGPRLILSRADPLFVKALFKLEVPEIQQQIVEIRATAREAGSRTKIAVSSRDDSIDPVGACVGLKGSRVQAVVNELNGERIDIVPWSPDPERFAKLSLAPARVARVFSDPETKTIQAIVDEDQLSLAIGRNGQNVRLASELTGWKIDLYSSREWMERGAEAGMFAPLPPEEDAATKVALRELKGLPAELVDVLARAGHKTLQDILDLEREDVDKIAGMTPELADKLMAFLNEMTEEGGEDEGEDGGAGQGGAAGPSAAAPPAPAPPAPPAPPPPPPPPPPPAGGVSDRIVRLLGLGVRAGGVVLGVTGIRAKLQRDGLSCVVLAADASPRTRDKVERLARARGVPIVQGPVALELGAGLGRPPLQAVGVRDAGLARGLVAVEE